MSQSVKVFKVVRDDEPPPPLPFSIEFTRKADPDYSDTHDFVVYGEPPAGVTLLLASVLRFDNRGRQSVDLNGMKAFFDAAMPPEDYTRFSRLIEDHDLIVPMDTLAEVFQWIAGEYTERPTSPSPASSDGRRHTGRTSKGTRLSEASS